MIPSFWRWCSFTILAGDGVTSVAGVSCLAGSFSLEPLPADISEYGENGTKEVGLMVPLWAVLVEGD